MEQKSILLELQYLPPIQYFTKFFQYENVVIEQHENYGKRSFRNRCQIATSHGIQRLSIPLKKGKNEQQAICKVAITYDENWQKNHWAAILAAYGNAPFFEHYEGYFRPFFNQQFDLLFDFNFNLLKTILPVLGIQKIPSVSTSFEKTTSGRLVDFRNQITPKAVSTLADPHFEAMKYAQVFEEKTGFLPNLSILDLIFCTGPQAPYYLENSIKF